MKHLLFFYFVFSTALSFAQYTDEDLLKTDRKMPFGRMEQRLRVTTEALEVAQPYLDRKGVRFSPITLNTKQNVSYTALEIETFGDSEQNNEARRVADMMGEMPLVFSPFDLSFGSNGYLIPDGSQLGVSYGFLIDGPEDSTYQHELLHATNLNDVVNGKNPLWTGLMEATSAEGHVSDKNSEGYSRFAALDEMVTSALSVKLDAIKLAKLKASQTPKEFNDRWGSGHALLSDIHFTLQNAERLSKQIAHLCERALLKLDNVQIESVPMTIGKKKQSRFHAVFTLESYKYEYGGRGYVAIPNGTKFKLFYGTHPTKAQLKARLEKILALSKAAEPKFLAARKSIHMGLELVDVAKSDIATLMKLAPAPYALLAE